MSFIQTAKRSRLVVSIVLSAGVLAAFWIVWFVGATKYQGVIDDWIAEGRANGYEISYDRREQFGFPRHTVLRFVNLHWKDNDGIEFHGGDLDVSADFWQTQKFAAKFKGQVQIDVPATESRGTLTLAGENGTANVTLADDGTWSDVAINMKAARIGRAPDYLFLSDSIKLSAKRPDEPPKDSKTAGLTLSTEADTVTLPAAMPQSFGPKIATLRIDLRVMGAMPDFRKKESVAAWNKQNGIVEFDRFDMEWGALLLTSKGTVGFDDDLQPEGAFASVIGHQDQVLETLMKSGFIADTQEGMLSSAMKLFAKPAPIKGEIGVEVPIAVQLGGFFLGPVRLFAFPPIEWN